MKWKAGLEWLPRWNRPALGRRPTLADVFVQASCMPAGWLLGSFVWLITSPLRDTKQGRTCPSELRVSKPPVYTLTWGQGHCPHAGTTPGSFVVQQPISNRDLSHGMCLNEAVSLKSFHSLNVWTVTLAALCLREEMPRLKAFGRTHWRPLIWILPLHVSLKCATVFFIAPLFVHSQTKCHGGTRLWQKCLIYLCDDVHSFLS